MLKNDETICAVITPPGIGAISVIRISGSKAIAISDKIFKGKSSLKKSPTHAIHYGYISDNLDNVLVSVFREPHSYTGEDSVEISCHGNQIVTKKILESLRANGARLAEAGEFTKRAFLNGKIDLLQAEAVAEIIQSRSDIAVKRSKNQLDGFLSKKITTIRDYLIEAISLVELELDFAEEDLEFVDKTILTEKVQNIIKLINELSSTFKSGRLIFEGINLAITGRPNVGKSSLLNRLLNDDRAIVSETPGTTRDIIKEEILIFGALFRLFDTAGLRLSTDKIEEEGVKRAYQAISKSDLVIHVTDIDNISEKLEDFQIITNNKTVIKVINKCDLLTTDILSQIKDKDIIPISALTGYGIDELFKFFEEFINSKGFYTEETSLVTNIRQFNALNEASFSLKNAIESIKDNRSGEFIALDLRTAVNHLKELTGEITNDDILNSIFSKFCIGK